MSVQLREPICSLGRRQIIIKPWSSYLRSTTVAQGNSTSPHSIAYFKKWPTTYYRAYATSAATTTISSPAIVAMTHKVPVKISTQATTTTPKVKDSKFWQEYEQRQQHHKDSMTSQDYEHVISTLHQQAQISSSKSVFWDRIVQVYETAHRLDQHSTPKIYLTAMKAYGLIGNSQQVIAVFKEYKKRFRLKSTAFQHYFEAIIASGDFKAAINVFRDIKSNPNLNVQDASICLRDLTAAFCLSTRKSKVYAAIQAVEEMKPSISDWDTHCRHQITEFLWQGYHRLLFPKEPNAPPITPLSAEKLFTTIIGNASNTTKIIPSQSFTLFDLLCHLPNRFVPTAKTFHLLLEIQLRDKNYSNMKHVLAWMQKLDIEPTSSTVAILLRTFGFHLTRLQEEQLYNKLLKQKNVDADFFKNYIGVFANDGSLVKTVLNDVQQCGIEMDATWHATMTQSFVKRGQLDQAIEWLRKVNSPDLDCFATVMEAWLQRGQWHECISQYEELLQQRQYADINRRIVKCAITAGFALGKNNMLDQIKIKFTPNTVMRIANTLLSLKTENGAALVPGATVVTSLRIMESKLHVYLDAEGISRVMLGLGNRGDCEHAFGLYKYVREGGHESVRRRCATSQIYLAMMTCATKNNDIRILERAWVDMQYRKRFYGNKTKKKVLHTLARYNILLNGYASQLPKPNLTGVRRLFQRLLDQQLEPDTVTYNILIKAFVNASNMEAANQVLQRQEKPDIRATNTVLNGWIIQRNWDQVEKFVKEQPVDITSFNLLIQSFLKLDSKTMTYMRILKNKQKWHELSKLKSAKVALSSKEIWNIFESATGYTRHTITNVGHIRMKNRTNATLCKQLTRLERNPPIVPWPTQSKSAFINLFSKSTKEPAVPDEVTYKLFMKAFVNTGDYESASDIYEWMKYSLKL
ncbi:hypothetical protein [Parasitella parasitica]|uniref:Pentacotripeptide-repeat region of PRORP domain-containing protein n=1 Tax=Parasitella parasitica TaxID=35722 RepID=A0A0B7NEJ5_9FUNG|nr:hypothetical protein [Parasitella parasitica]